MASRYEIDFSLWPERARPRRRIWRNVFASLFVISVGLAAAGAMVLSQLALSPPPVNAVQAAMTGAAPAQTTADPASAETKTKTSARSAPPAIGKPAETPPETVGRGLSEKAESATASTVESSQPARTPVEPNLKGTVQAEPAAERPAEQKPAQVRKRTAATKSSKKEEAADSTAQVYRLPDGRRVVIPDRRADDRRSYASGDFYGGYYRPVPPAYVGRPFGRPY